MFRFPRTRRSRAAGGRAWLTPTAPSGGGGGGGPSITLPFIDDFNRADGDPGNGWVDAGSASANCPTTIQSNVIRPSVAGKGNTLIRDLGVSLGYEVSAAFAGPDTYHVIMISSLLDQSHYIYAAVTNGSSYVDVDGVDHVIGGAGVGAGTMRVVVSATGLVTVYFSDALIGSYQLSAGDLAHLGTYSGVGTYNQVIDAFAAQAYDSTNLLRNPSFELDFNGDGVADSWQQYGGTFTIVPTVGGGQHGTHSQRLTPAPGDYCLAHQMVPAVAGHEYTLTTCFRIAALNGGNLETKIEWYGADGTSLVDYNYDPNNTTPGAYLTNHLTHVAPAGTFFAQAVLTAGGGCQVDLDFASLVDTSLFHDEFARADSSSSAGPAWTNVYGSYGVTGNQAAPQTFQGFEGANNAGAQGAIALHDIGVSDNIDVSWDVYTGTGDPSGGATQADFFLAASADATDAIDVLIYNPNGSQGFLVVFEKVANAYSAPAGYSSAQLAIIPGTTYRLRAVRHGDQVQCYFNGTLVVTATLAHPHTGTNIGPRVEWDATQDLNGRKTLRYDNVVVLSA